MYEKKIDLRKGFFPSRITITSVSTVRIKTFDKLSFKPSTRCTIIHMSDSSWLQFKSTLSGLLLINEPLSVETTSLLVGNSVSDILLERNSNNSDLFS